MSHTPDPKTMKFNYVEIVKYYSHEVVKRMDVSGKTDGYIIRTINGMNRNLNHEEYFVHSVGSDTELPIIN